jgi:hypothetical protein
VNGFVMVRTSGGEDDDSIELEAVKEVIRAERERSSSPETGHIARKPSSVQTKTGYYRLSFSVSGMACLSDRELTEILSPAHVGQRTVADAIVMVNDDHNVAINAPPHKLTGHLMMRLMNRYVK